MGKKGKECDGCYEPLKKGKRSVKCLACSREYCSECAAEQQENYSQEEHADGYGIDKCEHCSKEGENFESEEEEPEIEGGCEVCHKAKDEDKLLLCDGCDREYHLYCLDPPLTTVPEADWFCKECVAAEASERKDLESGNEGASMKRKLEETNGENTANKVQKAEDES